MHQGSYDVFLARNIHVQQFVQHLEYVLYEAQFNIKERGWYGPHFRGRAIWGSSGRAFAYGFLPWGQYMKEGNRYGAEYEAYQSGPNVVMRVLVAPYMVFFDHKDMLILTQGIGEYFVDNEYCRSFLNDLVARLTYKGIRVEPYRGQR
jgi:hypothetical protein